MHQLEQPFNQRGSKLRDAGVNAADIAAACTEMSKYIKLTAVVGSLKYLKMGGRLSGAAAFAGTMLHIHRL